jgi:predicted enzyme related to lactoylglutathione lyase
MGGHAGGAPRLKFTALLVQDMDASLHFYRDVLGVPLEPVELESGDPWLAGRRYHAGEPEHGVFALLAAAPGDETRRVRVAFAVEDIEEAHTSAVEAGADVLHPPRAQPFGRTARYRDPDGNTVALTQLSGETYGSPG